MLLRPLISLKKARTGTAKAIAASH